MPIQRDFQQPGRSLSVAERGMVATSHPLASLAALDMLRSGGNAVDAAVCAVAVQSVVDPLMTGVGGDCFVLLAPEGGAPVAINGSGWAPAGLDPGYFKDRGIAAFDPTAAHSVTVPGAVEAWCGLVNGYGRLGLEQVLAPAIGFAEGGFLITPRVARDWAKSKGRIATHADAAAHFLPTGTAPEVGDRFRQPALGATLRRIAKDGAAGFYQGEIAEEMVATLKALGGLHELADFAEYAGYETAPISAAYKGYELLECPPNGQGLAALLICRILDGVELNSPRFSEADRIHLLAEASKQAYAMRDAVIADPDFAESDTDAILDERTIAVLRDRIDLERAQAAAPWMGPPHNDTVTLSVVDEDRNAVTLINSIFDGFGSGIYALKSGVLFHNRGQGFSLRDGHPNQIAGRKRPFHTIIPGMLMREGRAVMPFGVMGAHYQAIGHAQLLANMLDLGLDPQQANEAPRSMAYGGTLTLERTIAESVSDDLAGRGHDVHWSADPIGGCQAIWIDRERGVLLGASDHRKDGMALGY